MMPLPNSKFQYAGFYSTIRKLGISPNKGLGRTALEQAGFQVATLFTTWTIAVVGGLLTGTKIE